jgi:hypothetical protein
MPPQRFRNGPEPVDEHSLSLMRKGAAIYLEKGGVASILMGIFNGNGAESSNSSVAYVAAGGKALFYSTRAFHASQGTLFEVEGSGTLLLDGGVFPRGDGVSFGKLWWWRDKHHKCTGSLPNEHRADELVEGFEYK